MEIIDGKSVEIELNTLDLRYSHTRVSNRRRQDRMTRSIERYGQLTPVLALLQKAPVLVDGYLRVASLRILGRDTVIADFSETDECGALLRLLGTTGQRRWEAVEQAWIIREIKERFACSLRQIACGVGRDISWVSRRVALIDELPDDLLKFVLSGHVSTWAASRFLVPLARANRGHADKLTEHLAQTPLSTRELSRFFEHYQRSDKRTRERMIGDPCLFVKVSERTQHKGQIQALAEGPEGAWMEDLHMVRKLLGRVLSRLPRVIYEGQDDGDRRRLVRALDDAASLMDEIKQKIAEVDKQ